MPDPAGGPDGGLALCNLDREVGTMGTVFTSYSLFQFLQLFLGWEKGAEAIFHHCVFSTLGLTVVYYYFIPELSAFAVLQEFSTPALLAMLTFRRIEGWSGVVGKAQVAFFFSFLLVRPIAFSYAMYGVGGGRREREREICVNTSQQWQALVYTHTHTHTQKPVHGINYTQRVSARHPLLHGRL